MCVTESTPIRYRVVIDQTFQLAGIKIDHHSWFRRFLPSLDFDDVAKRRNARARAPHIHTIVYHFYTLEPHQKCTTSDMSLTSPTPWWMR